MLEVFAPFVSRGLGIDLSREMLSVARANLAEKSLENCQVRQGDMYNLAVADKSQDLVLFHQVLHFADEPLRAIKEAKRVLSDDGSVLIVDFAPHQEEFLRTDHAHRRLGFADDEIIQIAEQAGLASAAVKHLEGNKLRVTLWKFSNIKE